MKEKIAQEKEELEKLITPVDSGLSVSVSLNNGILSQELSVEPLVSVKSEIEMKDSESGTSTTTEFDEVKKEAEEEVVEVTKEQEIPEQPKIEEKPEELSPFEELIRVASLLNPKQFELPAEMTEPFPFPGTERVEPIRNGRRVKNKRLIELDSHGCVPLPAKLCFACRKSCKRAPLISCDYCSLFFHQDCLDPPMTALPAGRWMCPNHPQHFIVSFLIFKISNNFYNFFHPAGLESRVINLSN